MTIFQIHTKWIQRSKILSAEKLANTDPDYQAVPQRYFASGAERKHGKKRNHAQVRRKCAENTFNFFSDDLDCTELII